MLPSIKAVSGDTMMSKNRQTNESSPVWAPLEKSFTSLDPLNSFVARHLIDTRTLLLQLLGRMRGISSVSLRPTLPVWVPRRLRRLLRILRLIGFVTRLASDADDTLSTACRRRRNDQSPLMDGDTWVPVSLT